MFTDKIEIKKPNEIRYGTTLIAYEKTFGEILALLSKHGCDQIATMKDGDIQKIGFVYQDNPYMIRIPRVFVAGEYNEKIGIRLVKYYLEIILDWSKQRIINFEDLMLGTRMVNIAGKSTTLKEAVDEMPPTQLFQGMLDSSKQLLVANQPMSMDEAKCPECDASDIDFITNPTPRSKKPYGYCRVCGHEWNVILGILPKDEG